MNLCDATLWCGIWKPCTRKSEGNECSVHQACHHTRNIIEVGDAAILGQTNATHVFRESLPPLLIAITAL